MQGAFDFYISLFIFTLLKNLSKIFLLAGLLLMVRPDVFAQTYDFRNFNVEDGLAQSQVLSMCQDRNGNIWFGTNSGGVSRYDGNKFITLSENDSLANNVVFSITEINNGKILFGTNGGLSIYDGKSFKNYTDKNGLPHNRVFKIIQDGNGIIWLGTAKGVCKFQNNKIIPFTGDTTLDKAGIFTIYADKIGNIWFGTTSDGLIKFNPSTKRFTQFTETSGINNNFIRAINEDIQGNIYVGTNTGICKINTLGIIEKVNIPRQENVAFTDIIPDNKNNLWMATNEGVYKYNGFICKNYREKNGLASNNLYCAFQDREGNFWFGTMGFGVSKFAGETFVTYSTKDSLPSDYVNCIFQDSKKTMWLGVQDNGICKMSGGKIINYKMNPKDRTNSLIDNEVQAICEDNSGNLYFGTKDGVSVFNGRSFQNYTDKDGLPARGVYSSIKDHSGVIWIGTKNGLCYFHNNRFETINEIQKFKPDRGDLPVYCIFEDLSHNLWLATEDGVIKYNRKNSVKYSKAEGFTDKRVLAISQDKNGNLWFGTGEGVFRYDLKSFDKIDQNQGLAANKVYLIIADANNDLWVGTTKGIDRINLNLYNSAKKIEMKHFGKDDGLKGVECNRNATFKDADGNLWFGTIKGVTVYNPRYDRINRKEALTRITGIRLFFQNADKDLVKYSKAIDSTTHLPVSLVLPYDKNHVTFDFIGVCITNPNKVKYQFKLEGSDNDWFPPTSKTEATYSSLPAGDYTFHLKAMNNDGLWNEKDVTFKFSILPPWYKTWWFYTLVAIVALGFIYLFIVVRTRNLQKAKIELEQEVELRTFQLRQEKEKVEVINKEVIEQKAIIEAKNHDITDSIKYAKNIQEALLPPLQNLHKEMHEAFVLYEPKDIVSGDFYWFAKRNNKRFVASVDCTGHGVPGAFMSIIGNTLLNEIVTEKNITRPSEILDELHAGVKTALKQSESENERRDGMDIALCSLNEEGNILEYAGANRPLWIFRKNKPADEAFEMIKANKFPIGGMELHENEKRKFSNHSIPVEKGDIIYIFSDGYADQFGGDRGKKFMVGNMQKLVAEIYTKPLHEQEKILFSAFQSWKGSLEQIDDVLVIGFRI
jgi:ligand-binding sensor domain-containing protein/serine phosphatase RsbU (regulator of sigma subunit)